MLQLVNIMASSLNGRIAAQSLEDDESRQEIGLSCPEDHRFLREQIKASEAIIVGATSIRANGECLDERGANNQYPLWIVLTKQGLDKDLPFWHQDQIPRALVSHKPVPLYSPKVSNWVIDEKNLAVSIYEKLSKKAIRRALLFGGGTVNRMFYEAGLVNELKLTLSPMFIAGNNAPPLIDPKISRHIYFHLVSSHQKQSFVFLNYEVRKI